MQHSKISKSNPKNTRKNMYDSRTIEKALISRSVNIDNMNISLFCRIAKESNDVYCMQVLVKAVFRCRNSWTLDPCSLAAKRFNLKRHSGIKSRPLHIKRMNPSLNLKWMNEFKWTENHVLPLCGAQFLTKSSRKSSNHCTVVNTTIFSTAAIWLLPWKGMVKP